MIELQLPKESITLVDDRDYYEYKLFEFPWTRRWSTTTKSYSAGAFIRDKASNKLIWISLSRLIMNLNKNDKRQVDHINHDTLDNRRQNLRVVTLQENQFNKKTYRNNSSGFPGIYFHKACTNRPWYAYLSAGNKRVFKGCYSTFEEAKEARIAAEQQYFGAFAPRRTE